MSKRARPRKVDGPQTTVANLVIPELADLSLMLVDEPSLPSRENMDSEGMQELMQSIQAVGLLSPIAVKRVGQRFEVMAGHRRLLAHRFLHKDTIRAFVYPECYEDSDAVMLHENVIREQLNPAEEAIFIMQLVEKHGYTEDDLVKALKRSAQYIGDRVQVLRGDPLIFEALRQGRVNFSVAKLLNRFTDATIRQYYLDSAVRNGATAGTVGQWLEDWNRLVKPALAKAAEAPVAAEGQTPAEDTMVCFLCGGGRDKYNLRPVWIHYWELDQVREATRSHAEAMELAAAELKQPEGGNNGA